MNAYIFPGQGAQFVGMGLDLYENHAEAQELFEKANEILGFSITDIMFEGTAEDLKQTKVTQPAIFLHSVILSKVLGDGFKPDMVAGHSLGEFSALVANGTLNFEDGLKLVSQRALAMQKACEIQPSTMAAVLGLEDEVVEKLCAEVEGIVVPANYNCPGQLVISGEVDAVNVACEKMKESFIVASWRSIPFPFDGASTGRVGRGHRIHGIQSAELPHLPECDHNSRVRCRGNQKESDTAIDGSRKVDAKRATNG